MGRWVDRWIDEWIGRQIELLVYIHLHLHLRLHIFMYTCTTAYSCMNPIGHGSFQFHPFLRLCGSYVLCSLACHSQVPRCYYLDIMSQFLRHHEVCLLLVPGRSRLPHWRLRLPSFPAVADKDAPSRLPRQMLEWSESFSTRLLRSAPALTQS